MNMKQELIHKNCAKSARVNRVACTLYMILVIYSFIKVDYVWAFTNLGIALVFDPFDTTVKWQHRPLYQKPWLLIHVALMLTGLMYLYFHKH